MKLRIIFNLVYVLAAAWASGQTQLVEDVDPDSTGLTSDTARSWVSRVAASIFGRSKGNVELGLMIGSPPFTVLDHSDVGYIARGNTSLSPLGVPLRFDVDLGSDIPMRGQRNKFTIALDHEELARRALGGDHSKFLSIQNEIDSLKGQRSLVFRQWTGARESLDQMGMDTLPSLPVPTIDALQFSDTLMPEEPANVLTPGDSIPSPDFPSDTLTTIPSLEALPYNDSVIGRFDSLTNAAAMGADRFSRLNSRIDSLQVQFDRLNAVIEASRKGYLVRDFALGLRGVEIGTCVGAPSEFLINGIRFNGLSAEYARHDVYVAIDHGRSYHDAWRSADASSDQLRRLQEAFLFSDPEGTDPRRLTAFKVGYGIPEGTHVLLGYLHGRRNDEAPGSSSASNEQSTLTNQVVEFDAALEIAKGHAFRFVIGRSATHGETLDSEGGNDLSTIIDREGKDRQAMLLGWRSSFQRTRTDFALNARSIAPLFNSLGMGYVRNGSRSLDGVLSQRLGKRIRFKASGKIEERTPSIGVGSSTSLVRLRLSGNYKVTSWLSMRGGFGTVDISASGGSDAKSDQRSTMTHGGVELRKRRGHSVFLFSGDLNALAWRQEDNSLMTDQRTWMTSLMASFIRGDQLGCDVTWSSTVGMPDSLATPGSILSVHVSSKIGKRTSCDGAVSLNVEGADSPTWNISAKRSLGDRTYVVLSGGHVSERQNYVLDGFAESNVDNYHCQVLLGFNW
jgi:hypothetical protein